MPAELRPSRLTPLGILFLLLSSSSARPGPAATALTHGALQSPGLAGSTVGVLGESTVRCRDLSALLSASYNLPAIDLLVSALAVAHNTTAALESPHPLWLMDVRRTSPRPVQTGGDGFVAR